MDKENPVSKVAEKITPDNKKKGHPVLKFGCIGCSTLIVLLIILVVGAVLYQDYVEKNKFGLEIKETKTYTIEDTNTMTNQGPIKSDKIVAHLALLYDRHPYQKIIDRTITPDNYELVTDEAGNEFAKFEFIDIPVGEIIEIKAIYEVESNEFKNYYQDCIGELVETDLTAEEHLESSDQRIIDKANEITQGMTNTCEKARAIYDWVGDNMTYPEPMDGGGALNALEALEGDCQYYADLYVALARAAGIPTRSLNGFTYDTDDDVDDTKHAWAESYLPGIGWTPIDPTWGEYESTRDKHFSATDAQHFPMSIGRNLETLEGGQYFFYRYWYTGEQITIDYNDLAIVTLVE